MFRRRSIIIGFATRVVLLACAPADQTLVPCADSQAPRYEDVPLASPGVMEPLADATLRGLVQAGVLDYSFVATGGAGTVFLLDARSSRLAVLDSRGRLQYAGGAKGGGPGEIGMAMGATRVRTDSFAVMDRTNARLLLLGPTGAPGRTVTTLSASAGGIATLAGPLGPDSVVILHQSYGMTHPDGLRLDSISLRIVSLADGGGAIPSIAPLRAQLQTLALAAECLGPGARRLADLRAGRGRSAAHRPRRRHAGRRHVGHRKPTTGILPCVPRVRRD